MVESKQTQLNGFCEECGSALIETYYETTCPNCGLVHNDLILKEEKIFFRDEIIAFRSIMPNTHSKTTLGTKRESEKLLSNHRLIKLQKIAAQPRESRTQHTHLILTKLKHELNICDEIFKNAIHYAKKIYKAEVFERRETVSHCIAAICLNYAIKIYDFPIGVNKRTILRTMRKIGHCIGSQTYLDYSQQFDKYFNKKQIANTPEKFFGKILNEIFEHPGPHQILDKQVIFRKGIKLLTLIKKPPKERNRLSYFCCAILYLVSDKQINTTILFKIFGYRPSTLRKNYFLLLFMLMNQFKLYYGLENLIKKQMAWDGF